MTIDRKEFLNLLAHGAFSIGASQFITGTEKLLAEPVFPTARNFDSIEIPIWAFHERHLPGAMKAAKEWIQRYQAESFSLENTIIVGGDMGALAFNSYDWQVVHTERWDIQINQFDKTVVWASYGHAIFKTDVKNTLEEGKMSLFLSNLLSFSRREEHEL